jgi:intein/homing endonuclease
MTTYGPNSPTSATTTAIGQPWSNETNIFANDASYATVTLADAGCFLAGTRIYYTDGSFRSIENIRVGDVISDAYGNEVEVLALHRVAVREYLFIETFYESIYVTDYHPFLMNDGTFKKIGDINTGEYISGDKVLAKTRITKEVDVYNLSVSGSETYIANNFKVHNK